MAQAGDEHNSGLPLKGRGSASRPDPRYLDTQRTALDDGWPGHDEARSPLRTTVTWERPRTIISRNRSPDIPFEQSLNPYRGCEHGCAYCYARPTHAYLDLSPGLDFETRLFAKADAARVLERELAAPGYRCTPFMQSVSPDVLQFAPAHLVNQYPQCRFDPCWSIK